MWQQHAPDHVTTACTDPFVMQCLVFVELKDTNAA